MKAVARSGPRSAVARHLSGRSRLRTQLAQLRARRDAVRRRPAAAVWRLAWQSPDSAVPRATGRRVDGHWRVVSRLMRRLAVLSVSTTQLHMHRLVLRLRQTLSQNVVRRAPMFRPAAPTVTRMTAPGAALAGTARAARPGERNIALRPATPIHAAALAPVLRLQRRRPAAAGTQRLAPRQAAAPARAPYLPLALTLARAAAPTASAARAATTETSANTDAPNSAPRRGHADPVASASVSLPPRELQRVTTHVLAQIERQARSWRERAQG